MSPRPNILKIGKHEVDKHDKPVAADLQASNLVDPQFEIPRHLKRTSTRCRVLSFSDPSSEINCCFVRHANPRKQVFQPHSQYYGLLWILIGSGTLITKEKQSFKVAPGDVIQITQGSIHTLLPDSGEWLEASASIDQKLIERFLELNNFDCHQPILHPGLSMALLHEFEAVHGTLMAAPRDMLPQFMLHIQQLIFHIHHASHTHPVQNSEHEQLEQACLLLENKNHFNMNLEQIASHLNMAYRQMRYLFKKHLRESPGQYRLKRKMAVATTLLVQEELSITQVSERLGYSDPFAFSRQFKAFHGLSPRQYRKQ